MPIGLIKSGLPPGRRAASGGISHSNLLAAPTVSSDVLPVAAPDASFSAHSGDAMAVFDPALHQEVAGTQQALEFLDQLGSQLEGLRDELKGHLTPTRDPGGQRLMNASTADRSALDTKIRQFQESLQRQSAATAGTLDGQLGYHAAGDARQTFTVRGLDLNALRSNGSSETLNFSVGGQGHAAASAVVIEPGLPDAALVHRFDRALAPSGVRAALDAQGELTFSARESEWSNVRDTIAVKGEGRRFPTGQFSPVRAVAMNPVLRPQEWGTTDLAALRNTRQEVFKAQGLVRQARLVVSQKLAEAGSRIGATALDGIWSAAFTQNFTAAALRSDYVALSSLSTALRHISRDRVTSLLSLPTSG